MSELKNKVVLGLFLVILPSELNGFYNQILAGSPVLYWVFDIAAWIVIPAVVFVFLARYSDISLKELGLELPFRSGKETLRFVFLCVLVFFILYYGYYLTESFAKAEIGTNYFVVDFSYKSLIPEGGILGILVLIYFSATAGIVEEIYYRGIFRLLFGDSVLQKVLYVLISSVIFSSVHWEGGIHNLIPAFIFGLIASIYFVFNRNLYPLILGHTVTNLILFI
ncbi:CPBP family intramembrane glutamic endopeptidase [candidate division KSB1 bacterium]